jgi:hypothetical protein
MSTTVGRLEAGRDQKAVADHGNEGSVAAILSKQDEIIDVLKSLTAKLDSDAGVSDTDFAALVSDAIAKIELNL